MWIISQMFGGENDHIIEYPLDDRGLLLLVVMVVIATSAFGIIIHGGVV